MWKPTKKSTTKESLAIHAGINVHASDWKVKAATEDFEIKKRYAKNAYFPYLFNLYVGILRSFSRYNDTIGIKVNGQIINNIRYAEDTVLIFGDPWDL